MRFRRKLPILVGVLLFAAAVAIVVFLRKHAPPEAARLLPQGDGFVYINLKHLRRAKVPAKLPDVTHDPEYEQFIQATGFQFEDDLEEVAFAIHYPTRQQPETRYSEIFIGKLQGQRVRDYLQKIAKSVDTYRSIEVYNIPLEDRVFRVAIIGVDIVAATNLADPHVMEGIIDRSRKIASPFAGPALLRKYYKYVPFTERYVPFASLGWSVFRVDPLAGRGGAGPFGMAFLFTKPAVVVASVNHVGTVSFRAEAITDDEDEAKRVTDQVNTFLAISQSAEENVGKAGPDPDIKEIFKSLEVKQHGDRAVLTAKIPPTLIQKLLTPPAESVPATTTPQTQTAAPSKHSKK
jgi:hypothetical protein